MIYARAIGRLLTLTITIAALFAASAAPASAEPIWTVSSEHGPTNFTPGGTAQYVLRVRNVGDQSQLGTLTLTDTLPTGMTALSVESLTANLLPWSCSGLGTETVLCSLEEAEGIQASDFEAPPNARNGFGPTLAITVSVPPDPGPLENKVALSGGGGADVTLSDPTTVSDTPIGFGFISGSVGAAPFLAPAPSSAVDDRAGSHPFEMRVNFQSTLKLEQNGVGDYTVPVEDQRTLITRMPPGFLGNPRSVPRCRGQQLQVRQCPVASQVGTVDLLLNNGNDMTSANSTWHLPLFNMVRPDGDVAALGVSVTPATVMIEVTIDPVSHAVVASVNGVPQAWELRQAAMTLWGVPADPAHDALRMDGTAGIVGVPSPDAANPQPFLTLPSRCGETPGPRISADSWANPGIFVTEQTPPWTISGCDDPRMRFEPTLAVTPTSHEAAAPTGLDVDLTVPQKEDDNASEASQLYPGSGQDKAIATPAVRDVITTLPAGMAVNPSVADGLQGCSEAQIGLDDNDDPTCPDASKLGTVKIESDLVEDPLEGSVYQARQFENPSHSLLGLYLVAQGDGATIKLAGKVSADPVTGQLRTIFTDNPQLPFTHLNLHLFGGSRAALVNAPTCGAQSSAAHFSSWNDQVPQVDATSSFNLTSGPGGAPCPASLAARPFAPGFTAGSATPFAGAFSPFNLEVNRADGTQELRTIQTTLPPGMIGRLAGIPYCPESVVGSISTMPGTGLGERLHPSCPSASLVGHTDAAAGAGSLPFHNPGSVYLTGPRDGAPLSLAIVTPVVAGPLDLGSIVVRADLRVDPETAQVQVTSDPIPDRIVADGIGFPLNIRSVRVTMDRNQFTLNPTSCDPMAVTGVLGSLQGASAAVSNRFQVGACNALGFKPRLSLRLEGPTKRGRHPGLRAVLRMPPAGANVARAQVALPHSEFLDQSHIRTICTRVQYSAGGGGGEQCPAGSIYGYAKAITPLLDAPLQGPVYLRSSNHKLPDLVASLGGQIHIDLDGRIDSVNGGIRTTFEAVPDAPVSKFILTMKGGKKGLLQNSRDVCAHSYRASAEFDGQNGKVDDIRPALGNPSCAGAKQRGHTG